MGQRTKALSAEHRTLLSFETYFNIAVWYAAFPPDEPHTCHLFQNRRLGALPLAKRRGAPAIAVPLQHANHADDRRISWPP